MDFALFADDAVEIEEVRGDDAKCSRLIHLFEDASGAPNPVSSEIVGREMESLDIAANFVRGEVFPGYVQETIGISSKLCYRAIARAATDDLDADDIEDRVAETGDLGDVAASLSYGEQRGLSAFMPDNAPSDLTVGEVFTTLEEIALTSGSGSTEEAIRHLFKLFNQCSPPEARMLARIVVEEMRIGIGVGQVRDAISIGFDVPVSGVERALHVSNDYGNVAVTARDGGSDGLSNIRLSIGRPVQAMLAQGGEVESAIGSWGEAVVEPKHDGARIQAHHGEDGARLFTRNMDEATGSLPEVIEAIEANTPPGCILDGEVVSYRNDGTPRPFQEVMKRIRREKNIEAFREEIPCVFIPFDCLAREGEELVTEPLSSRREHLLDIYPADAVESEVMDDPEAIHQQFEEYLGAGLEGMMLKSPDAPYTPGKKGKDWQKIKPDMEALDFTIVGGKWGSGRRKELMGSFTLALREDDSEDAEFVPISNAGTGITDEMLEELTRLLEDDVMWEDGMEFGVRPTTVIEVAHGGVMESDQYDIGYSLRFPSVQAIREKPVEETDTLDALFEQTNRFDAPE